MEWFQIWWDSKLFVSKWMSFSSINVLIHMNIKYLLLTSILFNLMMISINEWIRFISIKEGKKWRQVSPVECRKMRTNFKVSLIPFVEYNCQNFNPEPFFFTRSLHKAIPNNSSYDQIHNTLKLNEYRFLPYLKSF